MPTYPHICHECNHEWDDFYSIKAAPPTVCPKCGTEGKVERLIAGGSGRGIMDVTGEELRQKLDKEAQDMVRECSTNEKMLANIVGENKYHNNELMRDRFRRG
jgi:putative FmdB family regulatory protein